MRRVWLAWLIGGCVLAGCGDHHSPGVDSETHFLSSCGTDSCGDGLSCVCGVCTLACSADRECAALEAESRCQAPSPADALSCEAGAPARACDMTCARDSDCASISAQHVCSAGVCRRPAVQLPDIGLRYATGGQRIKAQYYVANGAEKFRNLYDSELGFACEFAPDVSARTLHCVPTLPRPLLYLDSQCKEPAVEVQAYESVDPPVPGDWLSALATEPASACPGAPLAPRLAYRLGEEVFVGGTKAIGMVPPTVYALREGTCAAAVFQSGLVPSAIHRVTPADVDQLVAGTLSTIEVGGGLSVRRVIAEDETQITIGVLGSNGVSCRLLAGGACAPEPIATESPSFYLEQQCEQPAFSAMQLPTCDEPRFGVRTIGDAVHVFELIAPPAVFAKNVVNDPAHVTGTDFEYTCDATSVEGVLADNLSNVFMAGKDVTATLPQANTLRTGAGSLHVVRFAAVNPNGNPDRVVALNAGKEFVDDQGHVCTVEEAVDGSLRCLPERYRVNEAGYWKDAACDEPLYEAVDPAADPSELRVVVWQGDRVPQQIESLSALAPYEGPLYQVVETHCTSATAAPAVPVFAPNANASLTELPVVESVEL